MEKSKVYYTKKISSDSLIKIFNSLGVTLKGKVGIKVSTGEDGAKGYLKKELIAPFKSRRKAWIYRICTG